MSQDRRRTYSETEIADALRANDLPATEWPLLAIVAAIMFLLGVLVTLSAYEIGACI